MTQWCARQAHPTKTTNRHSADIRAAGTHYPTRQLVRDQTSPAPLRQPQVITVKRALPCGDYGVTVDGRLVAAVERKSLADLVSSLINGKLRYALGDLAALPRAAVVVEDRYSQVFKLDWVRPAVVADGLAELQIHWPSVPIVFSEARQLAEEWTYRYLAAAHAWARTELALTERSGGDSVKPSTATAPGAPEPTTSEVRAWARTKGITVPDRGRLRPDIWQAWRDAQQHDHPKRHKIAKTTRFAPLLSRPRLLAERTYSQRALFLQLVSRLVSVRGDWTSSGPRRKAGVTLAGVLAASAGRSA